MLELIFGFLGRAVVGFLTEWLQDKRRERDLRRLGWQETNLEHLREANGALDAWLPCPITLLASACAQGTSRTVVAPDLPAYATEVQALAAEELERFGPPCPRDREEPGCSAVQLMMEEYGHLGARVRAMPGSP